MPNRDANHLRHILQSEVLDKLVTALSELPLQNLHDPTLCFEAFVLNGQAVNHNRDIPEADRWSGQGELILSHHIPLTHKPSSRLSINKASSPDRPSAPQEQEFPFQPVEPPSSSVDEQERNALEPSRKREAGLRPALMSACNPATTDDSRRQMQIGERNFPKRAKLKPDGVFYPRESSLDKFIVGIWEQIHSGLVLEPHVLTDQAQVRTSTSQTPRGTLPANENLSDISYDSFSQSNFFCRRVTQASRTCRSMEVIVQARWVELFDSYVEHLVSTNPELSPTRSRMRALTEACHDFAWSEKEMRNKMAIWRGYKEIKDVMGWVALVFSGMGLYRFCKYRIGFDKDKLHRAQVLRLRMEVAADTLHKDWRQLLAIVGEPPQREFTGHPHDWVVFHDGSDPVPLRSTYLQYDSNFSFEHLEEPILDTTSWGADDPRWAPPVAWPTNTNTCLLCSQFQSDHAISNSCKCFPSLFGGPRLTPAVQVFRTHDGRNNGLEALVPFDRGAAIGEFIGLITKGLEDQDVLGSKVGERSYQIWQGRQGNFTRFANHSCKPNAQFEKFVWLGTERILLVSKGIEAGVEVTVDYSGSYWRGLDKKCLCGEACCRYKRTQ